MKRREFLNLAAMGLGAAVFPSFALAGDKPQISITIDDFNPAGADMEKAAKRNDAILQALKSKKVKATFFVAGKFVNKEGMLDLVRDCGKAGHQIANHTFSHWYYPGKSFEEFSADFMKAHDLLKDMPNFTRLFRFPFLKEGKTAEQRDKMREFLKKNGYANGHVSIDASDWYIDERLRKRLKENPNADTKPYRDFYLQHLFERAAYYDSLSKKLFNRSIRHNLLLHWNLTTELFLKGLLDHFEKKGWKLIDSKKAFKDKVYSSMPNIAPAGESIIWSLAKESGKYEDILRYPAEDGEYEKPAMDKLGL